LEQAGCSVARHTLFPENNFEVAENMLERLTPETDMLFLCNPNNPTGRLINGGLLEKILHRAHENRILTVVDECFLSFTRAGVSAKRYLYQTPGLVVLKALTKTYALAGLRLGYMLASDSALLKKTADAGQCWSVSVPAQIAGTAALARGELAETAQPRPGSFMEETRRLVETERPFLTESLTALGVTVFPGEANFLLLKSEKPLYEPLLAKGILIRRCENFEGLDGTYYRICVKTRRENMKLITEMLPIFNIPLPG
ncbi:MAG: aminotransferase class I/II-fold pyridoxal phosphate-dependent enzyme, partial [Clostridiales bacterium]|jgi:threonine-phosphate decarboxylase|nr:aminotransferase class I/II-fold pyridoxal phosphate-dependent enzyme [Clostridiales bacterium]